MLGDCPRNMKGTVPAGGGGEASRVVAALVGRVEVRLAVTRRARLRGLIGRREAASPLLLAPARSIHTCGMRFAIDVVFLDADLRVVKVVRGLRPWRIASARRARAVLELEAGGAAGLEEGMRLSLRP